jgi:nickel-dependent lactate racemase
LSLTSTYGLIIEMKALIEIEMGNAAFGKNEAERLFELRQVTERLIDNATHIMAAKAGDYASAQDTNGNTVARLHIVED